MTQLYSNLEKYRYSTTYLCLVLAVLCSLVVVVLGLLHCRLDNTNGSISSHLMSPVQLSKCPHFILIIENNGGPTHGFKTKNHFAQLKSELPGFTILGKDVSG